MTNTLRRELIRHCSPTLAGIKTGNLFSLNAADMDITEIREVNRVLVKKGLRLIPLKKNLRSTLIYLYRPERLREDLNDPEADGILRGKGYPCGEPELCLMALIRHLSADETFPHEIGLFLGYPPSDVKGFMNSPCDGVQCVGCWKVYGNRQEAERLFESYRKCTDVYCRVAEKGMPLERLAVDSRSVNRRRITVKNAGMKGAEL